MFGKEGGRGDPEEPTPVTRLADFAHGLVLQAKDLRGPTGQPESTRGERQPGRGAGEQRIVELFAELTDQERDSRLGDLELCGGSFDRSQPDHRGERT
jgi:hypothetical protein